MRSSDWSSDVCSSDLLPVTADRNGGAGRRNTARRRAMRKVAVNLKDTCIGDFLPACEDDAQLLLTGHDSGVGKKVAGIGSLPSFDFARSGEVAGEHKATNVPRRTANRRIVLCKKK